MGLVNPQLVRIVTARIFGHQEQFYPAHQIKAPSLAYLETGPFNDKQKLHDYFYIQIGDKHSNYIMDVQGDDAFMDIEQMYKFFKEKRQQNSQRNEKGFSPYK